MHATDRRFVVGAALILWGVALAVSLAPAPTVAGVTGHTSPAVSAAGHGSPSFALAESSGSPVYTVSGFVRAAANGGPIASARLFVSEGASTTFLTSDTNGAWTVALPNGNYQITATAAGFGSDVANVSVDGAPLGPVVLSLEQPNGGPASSSGQVPPTLQLVLPFLPSAGVGLAGFVSWRAFIHTPTVRPSARLFR